MKVVKPLWIQLDGGGPVFSVDIDSGNERLATGGQGDGCGLVVLWHLEPVLVESSKRPKELCRLTNHASCVNAVRFAPQGCDGGSKRWLASGAVDGLVMLWCHMGGGGVEAVANPAVFGGGLENWRCAATLRGHDGDVLDVQWSPSGDRLATASVDNTVAVWQVWPVGQHRKLATLRGHTGLVKGVVWDPVGRYLASQSDDSSLRVWRTDTWRQEARVTDPFDGAPQSTPFLRPSWSPDGGFILAPNAVNSGFPTAPMIQRNSWAANMDLVGHIKAVTCCSVGPCILRTRRGHGDGDEEVEAACMALGSKDRSVSVWLTSLQRPLVVLRDLFAASVCDLAWSRDGSLLAAVSQDGSCAVLQFSLAELGRPLRRSEIIVRHQQHYGNSGLLAAPSLHSQLLPSDPHLLRLQQEAAAAAAHVAPQPQLQQQQQQQPLPTGPAEQVESRGKDGKRRITPKFLGHLFSQQQQQQPVADSPDPPVLEGPVVPRAPSQPSQSSQPAASPKSPQSPPPVTSSSISPEKQQHQHHQTGQSHNQLDRKRSRNNNNVSNNPPRLVSMETAADAEDEPQNNQKAAAATAAAKQQKQQKAASLQPGGKRQKVQQQQSKQSQHQQQQQNLSSVKQISQRRAARISSSSESSPSESSCDEASAAPPGAPGDAGTAAATVRSPRLPLLACRLRDQAIDGAAGSGGAVVASLANARLARLERLRESGGCWTLSLCLGDARLWTIPLSRSPTCLAAGGRAIAVGDASGRLHLFGHDGSRLSPPLLLDAGFAGLAASDEGHVAAVSRSGWLTVWQLPGLSRCLHSLVPAPHVSSGGRGAAVSVASLSLHAGGSAVLMALSSGHAICYSARQGAWMELQDPEDPGAIAWLRSHPRLPEPGGGALAQLQSSAAAAAAATAAPSRAEAPPQTVSAAAIASFLERQVWAARVLESPSELRHWLGLLARHLASSGMESRLRALCEDFLGPSVPSGEPATPSQQLIVGLNKRCLLRDIVLPAFTLNLGLQRLFQEVKQQLDLFSGDRPAHPALG